MANEIIDEQFLFVSNMLSVWYGATEASLDIGYMRRGFPAGRSDTQGSRLSAYDCL
jgi:hypothetical protein